MTRTKQLLVKTYLHDLRKGTDDTNRRYGRNHIPYPYDASKPQDNTSEFDDIMELSKPPVTDPELDLISQESVDHDNMVCANQKEKMHEKLLFPPGTLDRIQALERARKLRQEKNERGDEIVMMKKSKALEKARKLKEKQQRAIAKENNDVFDMFLIVLHDIRREEGILEDLLKERVDDKKLTHLSFKSTYRRVNEDYTRILMNMYDCNDDVEELFSLSKVFSHDMCKAGALKTKAYQKLDTKMRRIAIIQNLQKRKRLLARMKKNVDGIYNGDIFTLTAYIGKLKVETALIRKDRVEFIKMCNEKDEEWQALLAKEMEEVKKGLEEAKAEFAKIPPEEHERVSQLLKRTAAYYKQEKEQEARKVFLKEMWKRYRRHKKIKKIVRQCHQDFNTHMEVRRENAKPSTLDDIIHPRRNGVDIVKGPFTKSEARRIKQLNKKWEKLQKQYDKNAKSIQKKRLKQLQKQLQKQQRYKRVELLSSNSNKILSKLPKCAVAVRLQKRLANAYLRLSSKWTMLLGAVSAIPKKSKHNFVQIKNRSLNSKPVVFLKKKCSSVKSRTSMGIKSVTKMLKKQSNRIHKSVSRTGDKTGNGLNKCYWCMKKILRSQPVKHRKVKHWERSIMVTKLRGRNVITRFCNGWIQAIRWYLADFSEPQVKRIHDLEGHIVGFGMSKESILRKNIMSYAIYDKTLSLMLKDIFKEGRNKKWLKEEEKYYQRNYMPGEYRAIAKLWKELVFLTGAPGLRAPIVNLAYRLNEYLQDDDADEDVSKDAKSSSSAMTSSTMTSASLLSDEDGFMMSRKEKGGKKTRRHKPGHLAVKKGIRRDFKGSEWNSPSKSESKLSDGTENLQKVYQDKANRRFLEKDRREGLRRQRGLPTASASSGSSVSAARKLTRKESREIVEHITVLYQQVEDDVRANRDPSDAIKDLQNRFTRLSSTHSLIGLAKASTSSLSKPRFTGSNLEKIKKIPYLGRKQKKFAIESYTNLKKNQKREIETFIDLIRAEKAKSEELKDEYQVAKRKSSRRAQVTSSSSWGTSSQSGCGRKLSKKTMRPNKKTVEDFAELIKSLYVEEKVAHLLRSTMSVELHGGLGKNSELYFKAKESEERPIAKNKISHGKQKDKKRKGYIALLKKVTKSKDKSKKKKKRTEKGLFGYIRRRLRKGKERKEQKKLEKELKDKRRSSKSKLRLKNSGFWKRHRSRISVKSPNGRKRKKSRRRDDGETIDDLTDMEKRLDQSPVDREKKQHVKNKRDEDEHHSSDSNQHQEDSEHVQPKRRFFGLFSFKTRKGKKTDASKKEHGRSRKEIKEKQIQTKQKFKSGKNDKSRARASKLRKAKSSLKKHAGSDTEDEEKKSDFKDDEENSDDSKEHSTIISNSVDDEETSESSKEKKPKRRMGLFGIFSFKTRKAKEQKKSKKDKRRSSKRNEKQKQMTKGHKSVRPKANAWEAQKAETSEKILVDRHREGKKEYSKMHHSSGDDGGTSKSLQSESKHEHIKRIFGFFKIRKRTSGIKKDSKISKGKNSSRNRRFVKKAEDTPTKHKDKPSIAETSKIWKLRRSKKSVTKHAKQTGDTVNKDEILDVSTDVDSVENQVQDFDSQAYDDVIESASKENDNTKTEKHKTKREPDDLKKPLGWRKFFFGIFGPRKTPPIPLKKKLTVQRKAKEKGSKVSSLFKRQKSRVHFKKSRAKKGSEKAKIDNLVNDSDSNRGGNDKTKTKTSKVWKLRKSKKSLTAQTNKEGYCGDDDEILDVSTDAELPEIRSTGFDSEKIDSEQENVSDKRNTKRIKHKPKRKPRDRKTPFWSKISSFFKRRKSSGSIKKSHNHTDSSDTHIGKREKLDYSKKDEDDLHSASSEDRIYGIKRKSKNKQRRAKKGSGWWKSLLRLFGSRKTQKDKQKRSSNLERHETGKVKSSKVRKLRRSKKSATDHTSIAGSHRTDDEILDVSTDDDSVDNQSPELDSPEYDDKSNSATIENIKKRKNVRKPKDCQTPFAWRKSFFGMRGPVKIPPLLCKKTLKPENKAKSTKSKLSRSFKRRGHKKTKGRQKKTSENSVSKDTETDDVSDSDDNKTSIAHIKAKRDHGGRRKGLGWRKPFLIVFKRSGHKKTKEGHPKPSESSESRYIKTDDASDSDGNRSSNAHIKAKRDHGGRKKGLRWRKSFLGMFGPSKIPPNRPKKELKTEGEEKTIKSKLLQVLKRSVHKKPKEGLQKRSDIRDFTDNKADDMSDSIDNRISDTRAKHRHDERKKPLGWRKTFFAMFGPRNISQIQGKKTLDHKGKTKNTKLLRIFKRIGPKKTNGKLKKARDTSDSRDRKTDSVSVSDNSRTSNVHAKAKLKHDDLKKPLGWRKSFFGILRTRKTPKHHLKPLGSKNKGEANKSKSQIHRSPIANDQTSKKRKEKSRKGVSLFGLFNLRKHKSGESKTIKEKPRKEKANSLKAKFFNSLRFGRSKKSVDQSKSHSHTDAVLKSLSHRSDTPPIKRKGFSLKEYRRSLKQRREKFVQQLKIIPSLFGLEFKRSKPKSSAPRTSADSWVTELSFQSSSSKDDVTIFTTPTSPGQSNSWTSIETTSEDVPDEKSRDKRSHGKGKSRGKGSKIRESISRFFGRFKKSKKSS